MKNLRVAISGLIYPVTMMRFFWEALERRYDTKVISVGPYFGSWIPWNGGISIPQKYVKTPTIPLPKDAAQYHVHPKMVPIPEGDVDLWIQVDAGWHLSSRPNAKVVALVETDPHVLLAHYQQPRSYSDITFCMQTPYMQDGDVYLPYAADIQHFFPYETPIVHDVCLIGLHYPQRDALVRGLRALGLDVYYDLGVVFDEYREQYNSSKVAVSWSSLLDLPVRVFEAMAMKRPLVCNRVPDMEKHFQEGVHYLGFDDEAEGRKQVMWLLDNPESASVMAERAYQEVLAHHTWDHRIQFILETAGLV